MPISQYILDRLNKDLLDFQFHRDRHLAAPVDRYDYFQAKAVGQVSRIMTSVSRPVKHAPPRAN